MILFIISSRQLCLVSESAALNLYFLSDTHISYPPFSCEIRTSLGGNGRVGVVLGKSVCVILSISSYTPFIAFQFLLSHQVPEALCFPIIFLFMGEVVGTNFFFFFFLSVTTMRLVHCGAFIVIASFAVFWQLHEVDFIISVS